MTSVTVINTHTSWCCRAPAGPVLGGGGVPVRARAEVTHVFVIFIEVSADGPHLECGGVGDILGGLPGFWLDLSL